MSYRWANAEHSAALREEDGALIEADERNGDYHALVADGVDIAPYVRFANLDAAKAARLSELAARRWSAQSNMAYDGVQPVAYGPDTAGNLLAIIQALQAAGTGSAPWKLGAGAHRVWNLAAFQAFFAAGMTHVSACFAREATLSAAITAAEDIGAVEAIDIDAGWPA